MDLVKTKLGLFLVTAAFLLPPFIRLFSFRIASLEWICLLAGLGLCFVGSQGRSRWTLLGVFVSFALAVAVRSEINDRRLPWHAGEVQGLYAGWIALLMAGVFSFLLYLDSLCVLSERSRIRPIFWGLGVCLLGLAATGLAALYHQLDQQAALDIVRTSIPPIYLGWMVAQIVLCRQVSARTAWLPAKGASPSLD